MTVPNPRDRQTDDSALDGLDRMNPKESYRHEVLQSRRDRSRRAFFWARIFGLALMLTIGATLRSEPELRSALARAGMDAIKATINQTQPAQTAALAPINSSLPKSRVKVNRFGGSFVKADQQIDAQAIANELGRAMAAQKTTN